MKTRIIYDSYIDKYFAERRFLGLFWSRMTDWYCSGDFVNNEALHGFCSLDDARKYIENEKAKRERYKEIDKQLRSKDGFKIYDK